MTVTNDRSRQLSDDARMNQINSEILENADIAPPTYDEAMIARSPARGASATASRSAAPSPLSPPSSSSLASLSSSTSQHRFLKVERDLQHYASQRSQQQQQQQSHAAATSSSTTNIYPQEKRPDTLEEFSDASSLDSDWENETVAGINTPGTTVYGDDNDNNNNDNHNHNHNHSYSHSPNNHNEKSREYDNNNEEEAKHNAQGKASLSREISNDSPFLLDYIRAQHGLPNVSAWTKEDWKAAKAAFKAERKEAKAAFKAERRNLRAAWKAERRENRRGDRREGGGDRMAGRREEDRKVEEKTEEGMRGEKRAVRKGCCGGC